MKGDTEQCPKELMRCFSLRIGHMMGMDVHDMENLGEVWVTTENPNQHNLVLNPLGWAGR